MEVIFFLLFLFVFAMMYNFFGVLFCFVFTPIFFVLHGTISYAHVCMMWPHHCQCKQVSHPGYGTCGNDLHTVAAGVDSLGAIDYM